MKKYLLLGFLMFSMILAPKVHAADVYGFLDGKFYDANAVLKYQCFMDGNCYDLDMKPAPFKIVPISYTQPVAPVDVCVNIEGVQSVVPVGLVAQNGNCITSNAPLQPVSITQDKADDIKAQISSHIRQLNNDIFAIGNMLIVDRDKEQSGTGSVYFHNIQGISSYPMGFTDAQRIVVKSLQDKVNAINNIISRLNVISFEVQDYGSTSVLPPAEERAYLQSLGINW